MTVRELKEMVNKIDEKFLDKEISFFVEDMEGGQGFGTNGCFALEDLSYVPTFCVNVYTEQEAYDCMACNDWDEINNWYED